MVLGFVGVILRLVGVAGEGVELKYAALSDSRVWLIFYGFIPAASIHIHGQVI